ncbi:MAG: hypothetical protein PHY30_03565 [Candidatus Pacebacteria bacterium]|nr:hypothetical protein [Candidatus Paceibacterota bacterium]
MIKNNENIIGLREFRENTKTLILDIEKGSSFIVMKKNKPIFKISPITDEKWEEVIDFTKIRKGGIDIDELLERL